jgi:hypothetical protein
LTVFEPQERTAEERPAFPGKNIETVAQRAELALIPKPRRRQQIVGLLGFPFESAAPPRRGREAAITDAGVLFHRAAEHIRGEAGGVLLRSR